VTLMLEIVVAIGLLVAYRRLVQRERLSRY